MRKYLLTLIAVAAAVIMQAQPGTYSRVEVPIQENTMENMAKLGLPMDAGYMADKSTFIGEFHQRSLQKLQEAGIDYEIRIEDVSEFYAERSKQVTRAQIQQKAREMDVPVPDGFNLGSMGGFLTYDEMLAELDTMVTDYPDLITERDTMPGGTSIEGRPLYYTKISDNPGESEEEPEIFFTGMHHAREPGGMMVLVFYMYHLLENYENDSEIQNIVDNTEIYFAPCVNPDGYIYNEENNPDGGGMWRKNRRDIEQSGAVGVDINRNYGYMWGYDDSGSSPNPWDQTYRGDSAFSEPETQIIKQFCENHEFGFAINYHTYSDLLLYTWGYTEEPCEDDELLAAYSEKMSQVNNYEYGPGSTTIYPTNGGSDDWMYGEQETKNKIMSFTPEVGGDDEGFWPSSDQIIPQCQENLLMNILATKFTGNYVAVYDRMPTIVEEETGCFHFDVRRLGLEEGDTYTVSIEPLSDNIASVGEPVEYSGLELMETVSDSISFTLADGILSGDSIKYALTIDNGNYAKSDTLTKLYGEPVTIISDSCNTISGWNTEDWDITDEAYFSEPHSITDSPDGNYYNYTNSSITLNEQIDLSEVIYAQFSFRARWEIESGYDYVQTQVSTDDGGNWTPLSGQYTSTGTSSQEEGEPLYDGTQDDWVLEELSLNEFIGEEILIRFILVSDQGVTEDGFYFDDVEVKVLSQTATGNTLNAATESGDITVFPNPAGKMFTVKVNGAKTPQNMQLFNSIGSRVKQSPFNGRKQQVDLSNLEAGLYYVRVTYQDDSQSQLKKVVIY